MRALDSNNGFRPTAVVVSAAAVFLFVVSGACGFDPKGLDETPGIDVVRADSGLSPTDGQIDQSNGAAGNSPDAGSLGGQRGGLNPDSGGDSGFGGRTGVFIDAGSSSNDAAASPPAPPADAATVADARPVDAPASLKALLLVGDDRALTDDDRAASQRLQSLGFTVAIAGVQTPEAAAMVGNRAANHDLVLLTGSLPQGTMLPKELRDVAVPIICNKRAFFDNLGWVAKSDNGAEENATQIAIVAPGHPLAAKRNGPVAVTTRGSVIGWGEPLPSAVRVATLPGSADKVTIFGFEKGADNKNGPAAARRVGWFAEEALASLNSDGWALFDAAVRWAIGGS